MATFKIDDGSSSVTLDLTYNYVYDNTWSCKKGVLPVSSGTWTSSSTAQRVILRDSKGSQVLMMDHVPVRQSWGYPFRSSDVGTTADGLMLMSGGVMGATSMGVFAWELTSA